MSFLKCGGKWPETATVWVMLWMICSISVVQDLDDTISVVLRVYDVPIPDGPVSDSLALGQFSACTVPVLVQDNNSPQCTAPDDVQVLCEDFDFTLQDYGLPTTTCRVDSLYIKTDIDAFDTLCKQGTIVRTFEVFSKAGDSGMCTQSITVNNEQSYFIRFPDDLNLTMCDTSGNYGEPELFGVPV